MNMKIFKKEFEKASTEVNMNKLKSELARTIDDDVMYLGKPGTRNLIIAIEELAELQREIITYDNMSKSHSENYTYECKLFMIDEIADVLISLEWVKHICDIPETEIETTTSRYTINQIERYICTLQHILSHVLRNKINIDQVDSYVRLVYKSIEDLMVICDISKDDISKAVNVKLDILSKTEDTYF